MAEPEIDRAVIVIGNPGLDKGPLQSSCMTCNRKFPIMVSTQLLISKCKKDGKPPLVICHHCLMAARREGMFKDLPAFGVRNGMDLLGYS